MPEAAFFFWRRALLLSVAVLETIDLVRLPNLQVFQSERAELADNFVTKASLHMDGDQDCPTPQLSRFAGKRSRCEVFGGRRKRGHRVGKSRLQENCLQVCCRIRVVPDLLRGPRVGDDNYGRVLVLDDKSL